MSQKVTLTKEYVDSLKNRISNLQDELNKSNEDRQKFREFVLDLLKQNILMATKNQYYSPEAMINKISKLLNSVQTWWW